MTQIPHVVILGGGFGGLATANEIKSKLSTDKVKITIIDKKDWFMVGFAKLWIIKGTRTFKDSVGYLKNLEKKSINFINEEIKEIDPKNKLVKTLARDISFDYLVIALGASLAPQKIPGLVEYGMNLYDHDQLTQINKNLKNMRSGSIAIVITSMPYKCPPAPFEASLLIDSMLRENNVRDAISIDFYTPAPITLPAAGPQISQKILDLIESEKITLHTSCKIQSVEQNKLHFKDSDADFDYLLAIPPHIAPQVIYDSGLAKQDGFILINQDCKTSFKDVYAIGDVTSLPVGEKAVPKAGIFAEGEGLVVAKSIVSKIQNKNESFLFDGKGGCFIESGRGTAAVIDVDMFAKPSPTTKLTESTSEHLQEKVEFEKQRLSKWL